MNPIRAILIGAGVILLTILVVGSVAVLGMWAMMGGMMGSGPIPMMPVAGPGWLVILGGLPLLTGALLLVVWAADRASPRFSGKHGMALDTLGRRYAAGEIAREEYERIRADLLRDPASTSRDAA